MKIAIFGAGYVGLVTGTCFAETGNTVTCVDVDKEKIERLNQGECSIFEPGLPELIAKNRKKNRLFFTSDTENAIKENDVIIMAVGTPPNDDGSANLHHVYTVAKDIGSHINRKKIIIQKSTVPVKTGDNIKAIINDILNLRNKKIDFEVVSNPEFLKEGDAVNDFLKPNRVIIGTETGEENETLKFLYEPFMKKGYRIKFMRRCDAEMAKYACNFMLALRISAINLLARYADKTDIDIQNIRYTLATDPRIGPDFLYPGIGYGGSCFPKDIRALGDMLKSVDENNQLIQVTEDINREQVYWFTSKINEVFNENIPEKTFAIWGGAFKANTDDTRESSAVALMDLLLRYGAKLRIYDPQAMDNLKREFKKVDPKRVIFGNSEYEILSEADALIVCTEWLSFRNPDLNRIKNELKNPIIFDGRNLYNPDFIREKGFSYYSVGRDRV